MTKPDGADSVDTPDWLKKLIDDFAYELLELKDQLQPDDFDAQEPTLKRLYEEQLHQYISDGIGKTGKHTPFCNEITVCHHIVAERVRQQIRNNLEIGGQR